jgi:hypothetical protein
MPFSDSLLTLVSWNPGGHRHEGAVPIVNPIRWQLIENRAMLLLDV